MQEQHVEFDFRRIRFELDFPTKTFHAVRFPDSDPISSYLSAKGFSSDADVLAAIDIWGTNTVDVPVPHFMDMLKEQMLAPFFCFQVFCVLLWCMDAYWYYSLFTLFMLVMFECTVVFSRTRTLNDLRAIQVPKSQLQVCPPAPTLTVSMQPTSTTSSYTNAGSSFTHLELVVTLRFTLHPNCGQAPIAESVLSTAARSGSTCAHVRRCTAVGSGRSCQGRCCCPET